MIDSRKWAAVLSAITLAACGQAEDASLTGAASAEQSASSASPGAVFVLGNEAGGNAVLAFDRGPDGRLAAAGRFPTGGLGTGSGLGSQGSLALSHDGRWLFAVDAGSDELTLFRVRGTSLERSARISTGGTMPVSVTVHGELAFVVHAGSGDIAGFERTGGDLRAIPGSILPLGGAGPAQISFDPRGDVLVVSEKATNSFSLYAVDRDGGVAGPTSFASAGVTPFGFAFATNDLLVVSEAFGGAPGASALSSYRLDGGELVAVDPVVGDGQTAACWVAIPRDARYAYTTNTGSDNVSIYALSRDGDLQPSAPPAPTGTGSVPIDAALSRDGRWLYVLDSGLGTISAFHVSSDGLLTPLDDASGLPASTVGLVAR